MKVEFDVFANLDVDCDLIQFELDTSLPRTSKEFIPISGMTHVRTSPFYPQSNGKTERWRQSLEGECIRPGTPLSLDDARRLVSG
jgi:hypothetical protein